MKRNATILAFPLVASTEQKENLARHFVRVELHSQALDLAVATDELSLRIERTLDCPMTLLKIQQYSQDLAKIRTLLDLLQENMDQFGSGAPLVMTDS